VSLDNEDLEQLYEMDDDELGEFVEEQLEEAGYDPEAVYQAEFGNEDDDEVEVEDAEGGVEKESMAKLAEADFYGRAMAHAYVDELEKIAGPVDRAKALYKSMRTRQRTGYQSAKAAVTGKGSLDGRQYSGEARRALSMDALKQLSPELGGAAGAAAAGAGAAAYRRRRRKK